MANEVTLGRRPFGFRSVEDSPERSHLSPAPSGGAGREGSNGLPPDFVGFEPEWQAIPEAELGSAPWCSICSIRVGHGAAMALAGTGWLVESRTIVTAAHVVAVADRGNGDLRIEATFPSSTQAVRVIDARIHNEYRGDATSLFDAFDVAALKIDLLDLPALPIRNGLPKNATVEVAGYPEREQGTLVSDDGRAFRPDSVIYLHEVDTSPGHSGAPLLFSAVPGERSVIALHVHGHTANPHSAEFPNHNVALPVDGSIAAFIRTHAAAWR